MKRVLYKINSLPHRRVFKSYVERAELEQMVIGPPPAVIDGILEDYSGFGIRDVRTYSSNKEAQSIVDSFSPDVFVISDFPKTVSVPGGCKRVYAGHGTMPGHIMSLVSYDPNSKWNNFDLLCGSGDMFKELVRHVTGKKYDILTNALGQFDLLSDPKYYMPHSGNVLFGTNRPSILFCGFCCKNNSDFELHNEDYFMTLLELERLSKKHDWLIVVKPRQAVGKVMNFLKQVAWGKKYSALYKNLVNSDYLHFIDSSSDPYRYFSADIIMCNGCSTLEVEACIAEKPLVVVRTQVGADYDPYSTVMFGAASLVSDIGAVEGVLANIFAGEVSRVAEQRALVSDMDIIADGLAHKRIQDRIIDMCG